MRQKALSRSKKVLIQRRQLSLPSERPTEYRNCSSHERHEASCGASAFYHCLLDSVLPSTSCSIASPAGAAGIAKACANKRVIGVDSGTRCYDFFGTVSKRTVYCARPGIDRGPRPTLSWDSRRGINRAATLVFQSTDSRRLLGKGSAWVLARNSSDWQASIARTNGCRCRIRDDYNPVFLGGWLLAAFR